MQLHQLRSPAQVIARVEQSFCDSLEFLVFRSVTLLLGSISCTDRIKITTTLART